MWLTTVSSLVTALPLLLFFDYFPFVFLYQLHMVNGARLIDLQWRRVGSSSVLQAQTSGQALKLAVLSLAWPIALPMIRARIDLHLAGVLPPLGDSPPTT